MKLKSTNGQATTIPLEDGSAWTIEAEGTEVPDHVGEIILEKAPDQFEKVEEEEG